MDYKEIAKYAKPFSETGNILHALCVHGAGPLSAPLCMNKALACEIFMKAIIVRNDEAVTKKQLEDKGHSLYTLFDALPFDVQCKIKERIPDSKVKKYQEDLKVRADAMREQVREEEKGHVGYMVSQSVSTFDEILKKNEKIFIKWRYGYETPRGEYILCDIGFLMDFCAALEDIALADTEIA